MAREGISFSFGVSGATHEESLANAHEALKEKGLPRDVFNLVLSVLGEITIHPRFRGRVAHVQVAGHLDGVPFQSEWVNVSVRTRAGVQS